MKYRSLIVILLLGFILFTSFNESKSQFVKAVVAVTGSVFDAVTREPVTVYIVVLDENGKRVNATRSNAIEGGKYYIPSLKPGNKYYISISQNNYFKEKFEINIANTDKYTEISKDFLIIPLAKGVRIPLAVPPFEFNKSKLRFGAQDLLDDMKTSLKNNPEVNFEIECYPDNNADRNENQKLTEERANMLKNFFVSNGIDASRIRIKANTSTDPKNPPPAEKRAKGKKYIGSTYIVLL